MCCDIVGSHYNTCAAEMHAKHVAMTAPMDVAQCDAMYAALYVVVYAVMDNAMGLELHILMDVPMEIAMYTGRTWQSKEPRHRLLGTRRRPRPHG